MSSVKFKFILKDLGVMRFWSVWTRRYIVNNVVRRCIRDRGVREVIQCFKHTILRPRRTLLLSVTAAYKSGGDGSFSCDQGITDDELQALLEELQGVAVLAKTTLYCTGCGKRLVIDKKQPQVRYCACKEPKSEVESSDGWVPYMEAEDVIIWRKEYKPGKGLYAYKVYGRYPEVAASDFAAVQIDGAYRRSWDSAVAALAVVQRDARGVPGQAVLHWEVLWPRLFANRDYVYIRRHKEFDIKTKLPAKLLEEKPFENSASVHAKAKRKSLETYARERDEGSGKEIENKVYIIVSKSCEHPDVPETKHAIRVSEYWSHMVVRTVDGAEKTGMEFVLTYYDEPAVGGMPGGVAAWASSRAAPAYLARMRRAAGDYRQWLRGRPAQELPDFMPFGPEQVNNEQALEERDMESSKLGPEMENGERTRDQSSQTDDFLIQSITKHDKRDGNGKNPKEKQGQRDEADNVRSKEVLKDIDRSEDNKTDGADGKGDDKKVVDDKDRSVENTEVKNKLEATSHEKETAEGEETTKTPEEEENNGGWWRYLYPFYYFV